MLGIYLNDHLAGATAGTGLAHRMARSHGDGQDGSTLRRLAAEIAQNRAALPDIMAALGIKVRRYKVSAAWIGEKARRLKFNGRTERRSCLLTPARTAERNDGGAAAAGPIASLMPFSPNPDMKMGGGESETEYSRAVSIR